MRHPEECKTDPLDEEIAALIRRAIDAEGRFSSTAHREPTLAALERGTKTAVIPFSSTAHREPTLRLAAAQGKL